MATNPKGNNETKTISFSKELYREAKRRADNFDMNFSTYIQHLVQKDVRDGGPIVIYPRGEPVVSSDGAGEASRKESQADSLHSATVPAKKRVP